MVYKRFITSSKKFLRSNILGIFAVIVPFALLILLASACTTMYSETVSEDGSFYKQKIKVPPFGKLEKGAASYSVEIAPDGSYRTQVGGDLVGTDNTAQVEAMNGFMSALMSFGVQMGKVFAAGSGSAAPVQIEE